MAAVSKQRKFKGPSAIFDALNFAMDQFGEIREGDSIVLITDGGDNHTIHQKEAKTRIEKAGARVFVFLLNGDDHSTVEERGGRDEMLELTEKTGGLLIPIDSQANPKFGRNLEVLDALAKRMVSRINFSNRLTLQIPDSAIGNNGALKLALSRKNPNLRDIRFEYPRKLSVCSPSVKVVSAQP